MRITRLLVAALLALAGVVATAAPAQATSEVQLEIDRVIAEHGGVQTAWNQVSWNDGDVVLTVASSSGIATYAVGTCASGKYCVYSGLSYTGSVLTFASCTTGNSVNALPQVRSIANSRISGTVRAYNGSTLVTTVAANTGVTSIAGAVTTVSCS